MIPILVSAIGLIIIGIVVKLFDDSIRESRYGKSIVVYSTMVLLLIFVFSIIKLLIGG